MQSAVRMIQNLFRWYKFALAGDLRTSIVVDNVRLSIPEWTRLRDSAASEGAHGRDILHSSQTRKLQSRPLICRSGQGKVRIFAQLFVLLPRVYKKYLPGNKPRAARNGRLQAFFARFANLIKTHFKY